MGVGPQVDLRKTAVVKLGGVTVHGRPKFLPRPGDMSRLRRCLETYDLDRMYRLLTEMRNEARAVRLGQICAEIILPLKHEGRPVVVVVSAFDRATDKLEEMVSCIASVGPECGQDTFPHQRERARCLMTGELRANAALAIALNSYGYEARSLTGREAGIITKVSDGPVGAHIEKVRPHNIKQMLRKGVIPVVAGFQGYYRCRGRAEVSILGRGGSNLTAVAIADALGVRECTMFTDVDGLYEHDPRKPRYGRPPKKYDEIKASDLLAQYRGKQFPRVIQREAVEYALEKGVDIIIRDGFHVDRPGSRIVAE